MANNSPTIVAASLSDDQLKKSIESLVTHVDEAMKKMVQSTNNAVGEMEAKLKSLGNIKIDSGGSADGGASKRAKAQNEETAAIKESTKAYKEKKMALDQIASAQQVAIRSASPNSIRNADTLQTMNIQLDLLRERLREARQQYSSFVALASYATTTGDKGLFQYATDGVHRYEQEVRSLIPQIRGLQDGIQQMGNVLAPQGHTIQNYVNSLQKANPELAQLNEQFKRGKSLLQQQKTEFEQNAQAQHNSVNATNQQKQTLDEMNAYMRQSIQREQERRDAIRQTGLAARETADQLIRSAHEQVSAQGNSPITGIKELTAAIKQMRQAYFDMSASEKASPIGLALEADIKRANDAITIIRKYNQSLLGLQQNDANKKTNASTLNSLRESLKKLTEQYNRLTVAELNAGKGDALIQHFQNTTRAAQILQRTLNRPVNLKAALSGDERTLDDIAYKMQRLRAYKQGIDLTKPNAANEIKQVDEALARLQKDADKWMSKSQEMIKNNTALGRSWNYMKNRLAFYFTVGASTQFIKNLIEVRSQYEMNERALGILINSAERGTQIFNELSQMALVSPYTLIELSTAAKQLTAYDVAAKDVVDTTRRLADMAAAVGIPIERLTYALGQIKAYGYLNSRDARMFANAGIPLVKQLSDYYTELEGRLVSTADVYDRIKKKAIDYNEVMEVINKMTDQGGKFFDFQAKMADTLKVRLANLTLAWNNMLNDMGKESQGVLTWGIGALRELFLQWKQLDNLIKDIALAVGVRTLFVALRAATIGLGSFGKAMTWNAILGKKLGGVVVGLAKSFGTLFSSRLTWFALLAIAAVEATQAIFGVNEAQKALNESIRNGAKDNYDNISKFLEQYKEIRESLYATQKVAIGSIYNPTTRKAEATSYAEQQVEQDVDKNEAKKAWEAVREQIELTVASSDKYIGNLLSISNMSERVRQGFNLLDDVQVVNAALKELDDDTIKVSKDLSAWWNAWQAPDGLVGNLKDYQETLNDIIAKYGTLESFRENTFLGGKGSDDLNDYETALERFRDDLQKTTDSIINFIELKGWSGDESKINQVFEQITQKLVTDNQLDPQKAFTLQTEVEEARSKAAKQALLQRINDEKEAYKISHDEQLRQSINADVERYNSWNETNGRSKVEWERFTKWLKEQHISETTAMFRNMDAEDIKSLNFQEGKHAEWVTRMVTQYAKEHKMSIDDVEGYLKNFVRNANRMSIFIPLIISTEDKKSVYDQLGEYDKAVDEADAQIERLTKRIGELNAKKKKSKEETQELANAEQELADAQKAKADAEAKGGHGKKEKKDERAANKAAKQAESELQKALKDELSTIDKVRSIYKDLTKEGMSHANAVERATRGWDETVDAINRVLQKNGLQKLDLSKFAGIENPRELLNILQSQLETLVKRGASTSEIRVLQTKIQTVSVEADKYDLTMITKGLNNELGKLKDEYELAVELDANPELGSIFADYMGIDLNELPKNAEEAAKKAQQYIDKILRENKSKEKIDIASLMGKDAFDKWIKSSGHSMEDDLVKVVDNYRQALHKIQFDESKKQMQEWEKLLEKYAEYEYKVSQIQKEAERERAVARKKGASQELLDAIDERERQELARLSFEEFQKTPEWIVATGDLAGMTSKAIGGLIDSIESYKKKNKELDPKQIKNINNALRKLYKQQREGNPFLAISNAIEQAKARMEDIQPALDDVMDDIIKLEEEIGDTKPTEEQAKALDKLKKKWKELYEVGQISASDIVSGINNAIDVAAKASESFNKMAEALGGTNMTKAAKTISDITGNLQAAGQGAAAGAKLGGGWGAAIGATVGGLTDLVTRFYDQWTGNKAITEGIEESVWEAKKLENAYKSMEYAAEGFYGASVIGIKEAMKANKELQLAELKRQLQLEQQRDSKQRDEEKIRDLQGQIIDLEHEIAKATTETINDLLGVSSHVDFFENMISEMISAFKNGEDAMKVFEEKWSDMIDNMVMKAIIGRVMSQWIDSLEKGVNEIVEKYTKEYSQGKANNEQKIQNLATMDAGDFNRWLFENERTTWRNILNQLGEPIPNESELFWDTSWFNNAWDSGLAQRIADMYRKGVQSSINELDDKINNASLDAIDELLNYYMDSGKEIGELLKTELPKLLEQYGISYGQDSQSTLSALQQGIQGITENTAEALEAHMNGVSQQVYLHSDLLTQIRDAVVGIEIDAQIATQAQMLLQLQQSYTVQMAIQGILEGWSSPNGMSVRVEMQ